MSRRGSLLLPLLAILAMLAAAGCGATATGDSGAVRIVAAENFWGSIAAQLGGDRSSVQSIIANPDDRPARLRADAPRTRARWPSAQLVIVNGIGYDPWAPKLLAANPVNRTRPQRRRPARARSRATTRTSGTRPADVADGDRRDHRRLREARPGGRGLLRARGRQRSRRAGLARYHRLIAPDQRRYRRRPRRRLGEHLRAAGAGARAEAADAAELPEGDQRGHRADRRGQGDGRAQIARARDQGLGLQQPERDARRPAAHRRSPATQASRSTTITETLTPASASFQQWQVAPARRLAAALRAGDRPMSAHRTRSSSCAAPRAGVGGTRRSGATSTSTSAAGEFVAVLGPNGAGKSTLLKAHPRPAPARRRARRRCSAAARARANAGSATCRSAAASTRHADPRRRPRAARPRRRPLGPAAPAALPRRRAERARVEEVIELVGASAYARRPIGELSGGEQQRLLIAQALVRRPRLLMLDEPLDSLDLPNQAAVAALLQRICRARGRGGAARRPRRQPAARLPRPGHLPRRRPRRRRARSTR